MNPQKRLRQVKHELVMPRSGGGKTPRLQRRPFRPGKRVSPPSGRWSRRPFYLLFYRRQGDFLCSTFLKLTGNMYSASWRYLRSFIIFCVNTLPPLVAHSLVLCHALVPGHAVTNIDQRYRSNMICQAGSCVLFFLGKTEKVVYRAKYIMTYFAGSVREKEP